MKKIFLYKKWSFLVLLNNLVILGFFVYKKNILFIKFDTNNFFFWVYSKKLKLINKKIWGLKKKFNWGF